MSRKKITFVGLGLLVLILSAITVWYLKKPTRLTYKIAYVGRYVGAKDDEKGLKRSQNFNFLHTSTLEKYIKAYNQSQEKIKLELVIFDNHKNPDSTRSVYQKVLQDTSIIAAIDNCWGAELIGAQQTIQENDFPMLAINGDMNNLDYGSSIFFGNSDTQVEDIIKFIKDGLKVDTINFISEVDYSMHFRFNNVFENNDIVIANQLLTQDATLDDDDFTDKEIKELFDNEYVTLLNTHSEIGMYLLDKLNQLTENEKVVGHASVISSGGNNSFRNNNEIIILTQSENSVPKPIAMDIIDFEDRYPKLKGLNTALFIRRCKDSWSIFEETLSSLEVVNRTEVAKAFDKLKSNDLNVDYDILNFDQVGSLIRENVFVQYNSSGEKAYSLQMNSDRQVIPNMSLGIEIIDIQGIDLSSNSFTADFYYWITADSSYDNIEEFITFQNIKPSESEIDLITDKQFENLIYKLYKVSGIFFENYNEANYPFDNQEISIDIQVLNTAERLRVSFDDESFNQETSDFSLKGWIQDDFYVTVDNTVTNRLKGNLELGDNSINKFKNISFRFKVSRSILPGILQIVLPLFFIGSLAIALLYLKNLKFSQVGEPLAAVFLTIIAFSISLSDITPTGNILTKTDYLFILTLTTVVASFMIGLLHNTANAISYNLVKWIRAGVTFIYVTSFILIVFVSFI